MDIKYSTDKHGNKYFPLAHEKGVVDDNGTTLETKIGQVEGDISTLQAAYQALTQSDIVVVADHTAVSSPQVNTIE